MGPGYHEISDSAIHKKRGGVLSYAQDTSKRTNIESKGHSKVVGPGSYDLSRHSNL